MMFRWRPRRFLEYLLQFSGYFIRSSNHHEFCIPDESVIHPPREEESLYIFPLLLPDARTLVLRELLRGETGWPEEIKVEEEEEGGPEEELDDGELQIPTP